MQHNDEVTSLNAPEKAGHANTTLGRTKSGQHLRRALAPITLLAILGVGCDDDSPDGETGEVAEQLSNDEAITELGRTVVGEAFLSAESLSIDTAQPSVDDQKAGLQVKADAARAYEANDADGDGLSDDDELLHGTDLNLQDSDGDGMLDGDEVNFGFNPLFDDSFDDNDGDRYPNVFEVSHGTNPNDSSSFPEPDYIVDPTRGDDDFDDNIHLYVGWAITAADIDNTPFPIIGVAPGVHTHYASRRVWLEADDQPPLIIGLEGAANTIIDPNMTAITGGTAQNWEFFQRSVIASLTFRRFKGDTITFSGEKASGSRLVDVVVRDNEVLRAAVYARADATNIQVCGSAIFNNIGSISSSGALRVTDQTIMTLRSSVLYNPLVPFEVTYHGDSAAVAYSSMVRGNLLPDISNLEDPGYSGLRFDGSILPDSPLIGRGARCGSMRDMHLELRPEADDGAHIDIGADQWIDEDHDGLPDFWEMEATGSLDVLHGPAGDPDEDGLDNAGELLHNTDPLDPDTDDDGDLDGEEVANGTDPTDLDTDDDGMPNGFEIENGLDHEFDDAYDDADGDRYPNIFEYTANSDVQSPTSVPTPHRIVDMNSGDDDPDDNIYSNIASAVTAADEDGQENQVIAIRAGVYTGSSNTQLLLRGHYPKMLFIGLDGAANTILDGEGVRGGISCNGRNVFESLTLRRFSTGNGSIYINGEDADGTRLINVVVRDNHPSNDRLFGAVRVARASDVKIMNSSIFNNNGPHEYSVGMHLTYGAHVELINTILYNPNLANEVHISGSSSAVARHSLVRNNAIGGFNNVEPASDPQLTADARLTLGSPAIGQGTPVESVLDMDLQQRHESTPDIGADQFVQP